MLIQMVMTSWPLFPSPSLIITIYNQQWHQASLPYTHLPSNFAFYLRFHTHNISTAIQVNEVGTRTWCSILLRPMNLVWNRNWMEEKKREGRKWEPDVSLLLRVNSNVNSKLGLDTAVQLPKLPFNFFCIENGYLFWMGLKKRQECRCSLSNTQSEPMDQWYSNVPIQASFHCPIRLSLCLPILVSPLLRFHLTLPCLALRFAFCRNLFPSKWEQQRFLCSLSIKVG